LDSSLAAGDTYGRPWTDATVIFDHLTMRLVLRSTGIVTLAAAALMAILGVYVFDFGASAKAFFIYWTIFFVLLLSAVTLAVVDTATTFIKFRKEHMKLHNSFRRQL
jgi:hypothetical protein